MLVKTVWLGLVGCFLHTEQSPPFDPKTYRSLFSLYKNILTFLQSFLHPLTFCTSKRLESAKWSSRLGIWFVLNFIFSLLHPLKIQQGITSLHVALTPSQPCVVALNTYRIQFWTHTRRHTHTRTPLCKLVHPVSGSNGTQAKETPTYHLQDSYQKRFHTRHINGNINYDYFYTHIYIYITVINTKMSRSAASAQPTSHTSAPLEFLVHRNLIQWNKNVNRTDTIALGQSDKSRRVRKLSQAPEKAIPILHQ